MVHVPAKFWENTSMRFRVIVRKLNVTDGQTDGGLCNISRPRAYSMYTACAFFAKMATSSNFFIYEENYFSLNFSPFHIKGNFNKISMAAYGHFGFLETTFIFVQIYPIFLLFDMQFLFHELGSRLV